MSEIRPYEYFKNMDIRALNIRSTLSESMTFGLLKHEVFSDCMEDINQVFISQSQLLHFIKEKKLESEFEQFCTMGSSE